MKTLDIRVAFSAVDRLTRPAENARRLMGQFGDSIQRTQGAIKNLERQARSFERARDAVSKADAGIVKARRQLNALNQLQRTGTVLSEKQQKLMRQLSTRLERLNESRTREIQKMRELGGELKRHGISLTGSDNTIQQAIRRTEQYNNQLERERQALARVTRARERYSRVQETAGKLKTGGALAIGAAAAGGYAAGRFLQPAIGFGKEMSRVQALTRIDKNSPQFKALREQALKLGSETQFTAGDAASGQAFLAMAGFTPQTIQAALPGVLSMATAGSMDLGETADIGSNILTQFGLSADQMDRVGDTLTAAFTRTNTDLRALGETMKYAGPVAGKLVDETKKRIGPGDIVFKNLPRALAVRGEWQERKIAQVSKPASAINITPVVPTPLPPALVPVVAASSRPVAEAIRSPVASVPATSRNREPVVSGFGGEIHVHLHNVVTQNPRELAKLVGEMVRAEMERRARAGRGSFCDKD
ncbi:phage tail tape measure protein [Escherichia coli]|uniref:phage tail tape measure protein n=2 Tax=Escherichia coli TaxID=562 RepID=UPI000BF182AE|nr:phage tail tape measure protein [Escherichia coli]EFA4264242.1 phage tail tape measure protein [Escherichia coli O145:H25]